jgi:hypothetical protein
LSGSDYNFGEKLLHRVVLGSNVIGETLFDLEQMLFGSGAPDRSGEKHVFVTGLARSGTTILMRRLYETGAFRSLTYRDMPFVLAPNLWRRLRGAPRSETEARERAHGDGIFVTIDSPEALEEIFWRVFCGKTYIRPRGLLPMTAGGETLDRYRRYVALILKAYPGRRYLSKNNNHVLRLHSIAAAFPGARILIPFRDPVQQAFSLMRQHARFQGLHRSDPFTRDYMAWLVHHEFGSDHRPFVFEENAVPGDWTAGDLNYWLRIWVNAYSRLRADIPEQAIFLSYEKLCEDTGAVWAFLSEALDLNSPRPEPFAVSHQRVDTSALAPELAKQARELHAELMSRHDQHFKA